MRISIMLFTILGSIATSTYAQEKSCCSQRTVKGVTFVIDYPCRHPKKALRLNDALSVEQLQILETNLQGIACFINKLSDYRVGDKISIKKEVRYPIDFFPLDEKQKLNINIPVHQLTNWEIDEKFIKFQVVYFIHNPNYSILKGVFLNKKQDHIFHFIDNYVFERSDHDTVYRFKGHLNDNHRIITDDKALYQYLSQGLQ